MTWYAEADRQFHYSDHSHNWIAPPAVDQLVWSELVRAHMESHRQNVGEAPRVAAEVCRVPAQLRRAS